MPSAVFADDYSTWSYSQKILLNTSSTGANVPGNVLNVPVLIRLNPGNFRFFAQTLAGGADIRFAKTSGAHLPYQIERWIDRTGNNDTAEIWLKIDTVFGNNFTQSIVMYWGNAAAVDSSSGGAVFSPSNGFTNTYHLGGNLNDATANNTGINYATVDTASGIIGRARAFNGSSQYFTIGDVADRSSGAISFWFRPKAIFNSSSATQGIYCKKVDNSTNATLSLRGSDMTAGRGIAGCIMTKIENNNAAAYDSTATTIWATGAWYNVVWTWNASSDLLYVDGVLQGSSAGNMTLLGTALDEIGRSAYDDQAQSISGYRYFNGTIDEFRVENTIRSTDWVRLCYQNQQIKDSLITTGGVLYWDTSTANGYQRGSGTWGSSNFWTRSETQLTDWPGRGYTAVFDGTDNSVSYTVTVSGTQYLDSLVVRDNTYTFTGGTLDLGSRSGIYIPYTITTNINSVIAGSGGLSKYGTGTLVLAGSNSYTGVTTVSSGRLRISSLADGGSACAIGASTGIASNLVLNGGGLEYTGGVNTSTNRLFTISTVQCSLNVSSANVNFTNTGAIALSGSGTRTFCLGGNGTGTLAPVLGNNGGATSLRKYGSGTWILNGKNTYSGTTTVSTGTFIVNGSLDSTSLVTVSSGATIGGSGQIAGSVNASASGATILPGNAGPGKLRTGTLTLGTTSIINLDLGTISDTIAVTGNPTFNGTVNIAPAAGFGPGTYRIFTYTGTRQGTTTLTAGTTPTGRKCTFEYGTGYVNAVITVRLLQTEPADTSLLAGQNAVFTASAIGTGTLSYAWQQYPAVAVGTGTNTLTVASVTGAMNGTRYRCIVSDSLLASDTSRWALLTVLSAPQITTQPHDTTVTLGDAAKFSVLVADTSRCTFAWLKTGYPTVLGTTATYSIATAAATDEGDYYCIITNPAASVNTDTVRLTVRPLPPEAKFGCAPVSGIVPLEVSFTDSSTGVIQSRRWDFGDGAADTAANPEHTFTAVGRFGVMLTVTGPGGTDITDTVYVTVNHPAPVARFTFSPEAGLVPLEVSFVDASTGPFTSRKWYFGDGSGDTAANPKHTYTASGLYTVALAVTGPGGFDSLVKKDSVSVLEKGQNPLRMSARFISGDQVAITINRLDLVDTASPAPWCDSIGIWLILGALPKTPGTATLTKVYRRASFKGESLVDTIRLPSSDTVVGLMTGIFWNDATVSEFMAENGCLAVLEKGQNPLRLRARHIAGKDVAVTIDRLDLLDTVSPAPWCDSIGIWFAPGALPQSPDKSTLGAVYGRALFTGEALSDTLTLDLPDSLIGLMVGIFWNNGTVSEFLVANGSMVSISEERDTSLVARITLLAYDSMTASLYVSWCIDSAFFPGELDVGIGWSLDSAPKSIAGIQVITAFSACTDTAVALGGPLQFDTLYHVALFVRRTVRDAWSAFNALSYDTVRTGHPFRQVISFFNNRVPGDTVRAFNGNFFMWKDSTYTTSSPIIDTLEVYRFAPPAGFAMAGLPVRFVKPGPVLDLYVGIGIDSLPGNASVRDVRMYRDSSGMLLACFGTATDSIRRVVSVRTDDLRLPFIAMVDTTPPVVVLVKQSDSIAYVDRDIVDSIRISDNIANVRWSYLYGKGEDAPTVRESAELRDTAAVRRFVVSKDSQSISSESGLRAWLIVDDAVHRDTINLSRPVHRDSSDKAATVDNAWYPIYATAQLASTEPGSSLIAGVNAHSDSYDRRYVRLFRWIETEANRGNDSSKWVEYDQDNSSIRSLFSLEPGRLFWLKTRGNMQFDFGAARTLSLKDTFRIDLPAGQFTDVGMPYRFGVRIGDVLRASGGYADSIRFYRWMYDSTTERYTLDPLYVATMSDKKDPMQLLEFGHQSGYSLYNPSDTMVTLRIPPVPVAMSARSGIGKKGGDKSWSVKLIANCTGEGRLPQVYLGYVPKLAKSEYPVMPSFGSVRISVFERSSGKNFGHYIAGDAEGGLVKELRISNSSDSLRQVTFRMESAGEFPENFTALIFDAASGTFTSEGTIPVAPHSAVSRWCSIGDAAWHDRFGASAAQFAYGLRRIYPNPARSLVKIGYTVPLGAQEVVRIAIFDLRGRRIWEKRVEGLPVAGYHLVTWNGRDNRHAPVGAGIYLIRLSVVGIGGKVLRRFEQPITFLP